MAALAKNPSYLLSGSLVEPVSVTSFCWLSLSSTQVSARSSCADLKYSCSTNAVVRAVFRKHLTYGRREAPRSMEFRAFARPAGEEAASAEANQVKLLTCRQCKKPYDPLSNHEAACRYHPAHYGGEVKRKWKSYSFHQVGPQFLYHSEETRAAWGEVENFWDCCGRTDPFDPGCEAGPHRSYDD